MACGSGTVAWWQREAYYDSWLDALTVWQPSWSSPIQVDTEGNSSYFVADRGGWLIWMEESGRDKAPLMERVRGVPLSVLTQQRSGWHFRLPHSPRADGGRSGQVKLRPWSAAQARDVRPKPGRGLVDGRPSDLHGTQGGSRTRLAS